MFCAISGEAPEHPVVSKKTGHIFEKRLVEKYIADHGKCPVTGDELTVEDLLPVQAPKAVRPRPPTATSIPSMLGLFQNEWDAVMLETYSLRQQAEQLRQELSHSLYQYEAACRVIARLVKERDELKGQVTALQSAVATSLAQPAAKQQNGGAMEVDQKEHYEAPDTITPEIIEKITELSQKLAKERKKRPTVPDLATPEKLASLKQKSANTALHAASPAGILSVDIHPDQRRIVTGGADKNVVISDIENETILHTLKGHSKKVTSVLFHPTKDLVFSSSADKTVRVWSPSDNGYQSRSISAHKSDVVDLTVHATGDYLVSASLDSTWAFIDILSGKVLKQVTHDAVSQGYTCAKFHPDGVILGTGTADSVVRIWDVKSQENVATFEAHQGKVTSLAFSENGYVLATSSEDSTVRLWDLRKLTNFKTLNLEKGHIQAVRFDHSGNYLGVAGSDLRIFATKQLGETKAWDEITKIEGHDAAITDFKFSHNANFLVTASLDRNLRLFA